MVKYLAEGIIIAPAAPYASPECIKITRNTLNNVIHERPDMYETNPIKKKRKIDFNLFCLDSERQYITANGIAAKADSLKLHTADISFPNVGINSSSKRYMATLFIKP